MKRRTFLVYLGAILLTRTGCGRNSHDEEEAMTSFSPTTGTRRIEAIERLDVEHSLWKPLLSPEAYGVLFQESTEPPFSSPLTSEKRPGTYICAACFLPLFDSESKFESGTGWPSFFRVIEGRVETKRDFKLVLPRTEYHCTRCGGHQGHVFKDGPRPTGLRYCNNGLALVFVEQGSDLPPLRTPA